MLIPIAAISVAPGHRKIQAGAVKPLMVSIETIGLQTPITVRPGKKPGQYVLVVGRHRMEACRRLGHEQIEAVLSETEQLDADLWEASENLHRADLTVMQRSIAEGEWIKLRAEKIKRDQMDMVRHGGAPSRHGGHVRRGVRAAAAELGMSETTARRSVQIANRLTPTAGKEAERLGLDGSARALEYATKALEAAEQIAALRRYADGEAKREASRKQAQMVKDVLAGRAELPPPPEPKTFEAAFARWFSSLDIAMQAEGRIWMLGLDAEAYFAERDRAAAAERQNRQAMH